MSIIVTIAHTASTAFHQRILFWQFFVVLCVRPCSMAQFKARVQEFLKTHTIDILEECKEVVQIDTKMPVYDAFQVY